LVTTLFWPSSDKKTPCSSSTRTLLPLPILSLEMTSSEKETLGRLFVPSSLMVAAAAAAGGGFASLILGCRRCRVLWLKYIVGARAVDAGGRHFCFEF